MSEGRMREVQSTIDEISITDVFGILWDGRITITIAIVLGLLVGGGRFLLSRDDLQASVQILPQPASENSQYSLMNRYFAEAQSAKAVQAQKGAPADKAKPLPGIDFLKSVPKIDDQVLVKRFMDSLRDGTIFAQAAAEASILGLPPGTDEAALKRAQDGFVASVRYREPLEARNRNYLDSFWTIQFPTNARDKAVAFMNAVVQLANQRTRTNLENEAREALTSARAEQRYAITDLENALNRTVASARQADEYRIHHLNEQAAIARSLNISRSDLKVQSFASMPNVVLMSEKLPDYLRGYEALEREAQLLKARGDDPTYVLGTVAIEDEIRGLKQDQSVARAEQALASSPLARDGFQAIIYNPGMVATVRSFSAMSAFLLPTLLGGLLGVVLVAARAFLARRKTV